MPIRESKLLTIVVLLGSLVAVPLACGGNANGSDTNGDSDNTEGDPRPGGDPGSGGDPADDQTQICTDLKNKIDSCQSQILCFYDTTSFVSDCVTQGSATPDQRDNFVGSACSAISDALCNYTTGSCTGDLTCAVIQPTSAICVNSDASAPAGATDCSDSQTCSGTQICGPSASTQSCFDTCAPTACNGGLTCTPVNKDVGFVCLQASGSVPDAATTCDTSVTECTVTQGCIKFAGSAHSYCVEWCFLNDGTYTP